MRKISIPVAAPLLIAALALPAGLAAQPQGAPDPTIVVEAQPIFDPATMAKGPEIKGIIAACSADRIRITTPDGASTVIAFKAATKIKGAGRDPRPASELLLNGLPVTVKTLQAGSYLLASQISFKGRDLRTAAMIHTGTAQQFAEQTAATEALRGRMGDIDKYNLKGTTNVYFDTGKWSLSPQARTDLCTAASEADGMNNALILVVGYTDSVGSDEYNQVLSEKRAASVINYLQQTCRWKPYRMLTPTGMAEADPAASNDTEEGKAQNRRVSVNILVSKGLDGL